MKVFLQCTTNELGKYYKQYSCIRDHLIQQKYIITRDWLPSAIKNLKQKHKKFTDRKDYQEYTRAINESDIIIVENTVSSFSTGHTITLCLQRKKPCLVLSLHKTNRHFEESFFDLVESDYLEQHIYNLDNVENIINTFVKKYYKGTMQHRFNMYIDDVERRYLDWKKYKTNESRSEIMRDALRERMNRDIEYVKYLQE